MTHLVQDSAQSVNSTQFIKNVVVVDNESYFSSEGDSDSSHSLNVDALADAFAEVGILCSTFAPKESDSQDEYIGRATNRYLKLVSASDAAVLDWQMSKENDDKSLLCKSIITKIIQDEKGMVPRLIIVYTGEIVSSDLVQSLSTHIKKFINNDIKVFPEESDLFGFSYSNLHIVFLGKGKSGSIPIPSLVTQSNLPTKIIELHGALTKGILQRAIFTAISTIKNGIPQLLSTFNSNLDPAFIHHLMATSNNDEAKAFLLSQIADELFSIIDQSDDFGFMTHPVTLNEWWNENSEVLNGVITKSEYDEYLGINGKAKKNLSKGHSKKFVEKYTASLTEFSKITDFKFEALSPIRKYAGHAPMLTFGTLIKDKSNNKYYVCIMPACDTIRLTKSTRFSLLELPTCTDAIVAHLCCQDSADRFLVCPNQKDIWNYIRLADFLPTTGTDRIIASQNSDASFVFTDAGGNVFQWLADIKIDAMIDFHKKIFPAISRMGTNTFAWVQQKRDT